MKEDAHERSVRETAEAWANSVEWRAARTATHGHAVVVSRWTGECRVHRPTAEEAAKRASDDRIVKAAAAAAADGRAESAARLAARVGLTLAQASARASLLKEAASLRTAWVERRRRDLLFGRVTPLPAP